MKRLEKCEMGALEEHVADQIAAVEESLTSTDEIFGNLDSLEYDEVVKNMSSLERAKYDLTNLYAINSLFWMYMRSFGEDPQNLGIKEELDRIKKQMMRVKEITDKVKRPTIDKGAAHRIVKHELWQPGQANTSSLRELAAGNPAEAESWENAEPQPMETDGKCATDEKAEAGTATGPTGRGVKRKHPEPATDSKRGLTESGFANMPSSGSDSDSYDDSSEESESDEI